VRGIELAIPGLAVECFTTEPNQLANSCLTLHSVLVCGPLVVWSAFVVWGAFVVCSTEVVWVGKVIWGAVVVWVEVVVPECRHLLLMNVCGICVLYESLLLNADTFYTVWYSQKEWHPMGKKSVNNTKTIYFCFQYSSGYFSSSFTENWE